MATPQKIIIAIGGGEIGRVKYDDNHHVIKTYPIETTPIDQRIIQATGKAHPKALFVPTASWDNEGYCDCFVKHYESLGCQVACLLLTKKHYTKKELEKLIGDADLIYVGGGNTQFMQDTWRTQGVLPLLKQAYEKGTVLCGLSAGANCWFEKSSTDSFMSEEDKADMEKAKEKLAIMDNLGYLKGVCCPHYLYEPFRRPAFLHQMKKIDGKAYGIDNKTAVLFINGQPAEVLKSDPAAQVFEITAHKGIVTEKEMKNISGGKALHHPAKKER